MLAGISASTLSSDQVTDMLPQFLPHHYGHLLEVRRSSGRHSLSCFRRYDDFPLYFRGRVRDEDCLYYYFYPTQYDTYPLNALSRSPDPARPDRFILTAALTLGYGSTMVANWFSFFFTYNGNNHALKGLLDAIELVMETGFAVSAFMSIFLNLVLPLEMDDNETIDVGEVVEGSLHSHEVEDGSKPAPMQGAAEGEKMA